MSQKLDFEVVRAPRSRTPSPILLTPQQLDAAVTIDKPKSGIADRDDILDPVNLTHKCETNQRKGILGGVDAPEVAITAAKYPRLLAFDVKRKVRANFGLHFSSNFECGNLCRAEWIQKPITFDGTDNKLEEYELYMTPDNYKTDGYCLWFFFRVENMQADRRYKFNIKNFHRSRSSFETGMLPVAFSEKSFRETQKGWYRVGSKDCCYYKNYLSGQRRMNTMKERSRYTLSFSVSFEHSQDIVYFALSPPYTFTRLQTFMSSLMGDPSTRKHIQKIDICETLGGNSNQMLIISEEGDEQKPTLHKENHDSIQQELSRSHHAKAQSILEMDNGKPHQLAPSLS